MLLQVADGTAEGANPPVGFTLPSWKSLLEGDLEEMKPLENIPSSVTLGPATVSLGHNDLDAEDAKKELTPDHEFGWDIENPVRSIHVAPFKIEWRPITNGQFYKYYRNLKEKDEKSLPKSWIEIDGDIFVRTFYGPISMEYAFHWPVIASYDDLSTYARVQGGRIPTEPELQLFYDTFCYGFLGGRNIGFRNWHPNA
jgi:L-histidine Nalpha-methyltransferase / hercynylcysteine S-oxide synthase